MKNANSNVSLFVNRKGTDGKTHREFRTFETKKAERTAKVATNKATAAALANYISWLDQGFVVLCKGEKAARDVASVAKGIYKTPAGIVAACYPYQTADGLLLVAGKVDGVRVWTEKRLKGAACAASVLRQALRNFVNRGGVERHAVGEALPVKE